MSDPPPTFNEEDMSKSNMPKIGSYGQYSSDNYGAHCLRVDLGNLTLYFSYKTLVAFNGTKGLVVTRNYWGPTTGKHLNWIDGGNKSDRKDSDEFTRLWNETAEEFNLDPNAVAV